MKLEQNDKVILVQACINSYEGKEGTSIWDNYDKDSIKFWDITPNQGFTALYNHPKYGKIQFIVFQGSRSDKDNGVDWRYNFDTNQIKSEISKEMELVIPYGNSNSNIKMHHGFVKMYYVVRDMVRNVAKEAYNKDYKIWVTGHSLGGAQTTAAYIDFNYMFADEMKIPIEKISEVLTGYAASSPKIGNKEFVESFDKRANGNFYNEAYGNDTVHNTPMWWQGYSGHVKIEKIYTNLWTNIQMPFVNIPKVLTFGILPSIAAYDHYPQKLLAAVKGEKVPLFWKL